MRLRVVAVAFASGSLLMWIGVVVVVADMGLIVVVGENLRWRDATAVAVVVVVATRSFGTPSSSAAPPSQQPVHDAAHITRRAGLARSGVIGLADLIGLAGAVVVVEGMCMTRRKWKDGAVVVVVVGVVGAEEGERGEC